MHRGNTPITFLFEVTMIKTFQTLTMEEKGSLVDSVNEVLMTYNLSKESMDGFWNTLSLGIEAQGRA